jgi:hypothetical protein
MSNTLRTTETKQRQCFNRKMKDRLFTNFQSRKQTVNEITIFLA